MFCKYSSERNWFVSIRSPAVMAKSHDEFGAIRQRPLWSVIFDRVYCHFGQFFSQKVAKCDST